MDMETHMVDLYPMICKMKKQTVYSPSLADSVYNVKNSMVPQQVTEVSRA